MDHASEKRWSRVQLAVKKYLLRDVTSSDAEATRCSTKLATMITDGATAADITDELREWGFNDDGRAAAIQKVAKTGRAPRRRPARAPKQTSTYAHVVSPGQLFMQASNNPYLRMSEEEERAMVKRARERMEREPGLYD